MKIKIPVDHHIARKLTEAGVEHDIRVSHVSVDADSYAHFLKRIATDYTHISSEEQHALAISCCLTHPDHKDKQNPPRIPIQKVKTWPWTHWLVIVITLLMALCFATFARCQTSQIDVITFKNAANTTVKSFAAPFTIKEGTGVTFGAIGSVLTLNAAGGGGTFYQTFQSAAVALTQRNTANFFGAIACVDNAGSTRTDCSLALNNAVANQYLTGIDASGSFLRKQIAYGELSGVPSTFAPTAHAMLSASHSDTTAGAVLRGDIIKGDATPKWIRLAKGGANNVIKMDSSGVDFAWGSVDFSELTSIPQMAQAKLCTGTDKFSEYNASNGLFTCTADAGGGGGASTADSFITISHDADLTGERVLTGTAGDVTITDAGVNSTVTLDTGANIPKVTTSNTYSAGTTQDFDTARAKYWGQAPVFDATEYAGADMCAKILAVYSDAAYLAALNAVVDARGFSGSQNCASNMLAITRPTWIKLGNVTLHVTVNQAAGFPASSIAAPATPTSASTTTTGGTLNNLVLVKTGYATSGLPAGDNFLGTSAEGTIAMNAACTGTPTCTATINSPAAVVGAYGYNIFQSTTTGTEKQCNVAPIPLGVNYVIKANCAGASMVSANWQFADMSILSGEGDSTQISLENAAASIDGSSTRNWTFRDMSIVSTLTTQSVNGMLQMEHNQVADNITFSGGGNHIYIIGTMDTVRHTRHYGFTVSAGQVSGIVSFDGQWIRVEDTVFSNFTFPVSSGQNYGIHLSHCNMCIVDGERSENIDNSQAAVGGSMMVASGTGTTANASSNIIFTNFQCDGLININCVDLLNMTHDATISNGICRNSNNTAGLGAVIVGADCVDIFEAGRWTVNNVIGQHRGGPGGACCPTFEIYESPDGIVSNSHADDDQSNEGIVMNGSPNVQFVNTQANRNRFAGINILDSSSVVTCNGTTTVAWVSGTPFGPWNPNTVVNIGAGPTPFLIASITDIHTLVLTTTCGLGASQAFSVYSQDVVFEDIKADDNGQAGTGAGARTGQSEGIYLSGHSQATVIGGSFNDNVSVAANKHQQYGIRTENSARARVIAADLTGNGGGSSCLLEGNNVAGNHTFCDSVKNSAFWLDDNATNTWTATAQQTTGANNKIGQADIVADSGAINTTETIIVKTAALPANRLIAGTHIRMTLGGTCTSTAANTSTFTIRMGTNGTTGDTAIATPVTPAAATSGTNVAFKVVIEFTVRTVGASGTGAIEFALENTGVTGIDATQSPFLSFPTMSTFNTTTAANILSVSYKSAATTTTSTFKNALIEIVQN